MLALFLFLFYTLCLKVSEFKCGEYCLIEWDYPKYSHVSLVAFQDEKIEVVGYVPNEIQMFSWFPWNEVKPGDLTLAIHFGECNDEYECKSLGADTISVVVPDCTK